MTTPSSSVLRRVLRSRVLLLVNAGVFVLLALALGRELVRNRAIQQEIAALEREQQALSDTIVSLESYEEYLVTEAFLEQEAREKFGLQRSGETQIYIQEQTTMAAVESTPMEGVRANIQLWGWYFFNPERYAVATKKD
ncbi:MAG: septum formation initiator family protein [Patescibacteria group bacterium]